MIIVRIGPRSSRCLYLDEQQRTPALYDFRVHVTSAWLLRKSLVGIWQHWHSSEHALFRSFIACLRAR
jgi:hypothetical protein